MTIQTNTPDAKVYIDNQYIGLTQDEERYATLEAVAKNKQNTEILLVKEDYRTVNRLTSSTLKIRNVVVGLVFFPSFTWILGPVSNSVH